MRWPQPPGQVLGALAAITEIIVAADAFAALARNLCAVITNTESRRLQVSSFVELFHMIKFNWEALSV